MGAEGKCGGKREKGFRGPCDGILVCNYAYYSDQYSQHTHQDLAISINASYTRSLPC